MRKKIKDIFHAVRRFPENQMLLLFLLINFLGSLYGFYWYREQLLATPWYFWLFVPDCPLATLLFAFTIVAWYKERSYPTYFLLTVFGLIKFGFWTVFVLSQYWLGGGAVTFADAALVVSHIGMVTEALFFLPYLRLRLRAVAVVGAWFFLNDYMDYGLLLYPYLPDPTVLPLIRAVGIASTVALAAAFTCFAYRQQKAAASRGISQVSLKSPK